MLKKIVLNTLICIMWIPTILFGEITRQPLTSNIRLDDTGKDEEAINNSKGNISYDEKAENYIISYKGLRGEDKTWIFEPATKIVITVIANVVKNERAYIYEYEIISDSKSEQKVQAFAVDYNEEISDITYPEGWRIFKTFQKRKTVNWSDTKYERLGFPPGSSQSGFSFSSEGIPGIVTCYVRGYTKTPNFEYGEAPNDVRPNFFGNSVGGKTVGPVKTGDGFSSVDILDHLISMVEESSKLGWIENPQLTDSIMNNLRDIKEDLVEGEIENSATKLENLLSHVESQRENNLTTEAFCILKYNIEHIIENLY